MKEETKQQKLAREMTHTRSSSQDQSTQPLDGSILKALVRGWMAGTAGIPGDLEGLARAGINKAFGAGGVRVDEAPVLPPTDFYKEWLPGKQVGDENVAAVGSLFGGAGMGTIAKGTNKAARALPGALTQMARNAAVPRTLSPQAGVIKAPGGNWLAGSVEDALKGLKRGRLEFHDPYTQEQVAEMEQYFLSNPGKPGSTLNAMGAQELTEAKRKLAVNNFVDKQLTRYVKNDMATERDPIRALAEKGVLHYEPVGTGNPSLGTRVNREHVGFDPEGLGKSTLARQWESNSDALVRPSKASDILADQSIGGSGVAEKRIADNPWLTKVPANSQVNEIYSGSRISSLGFDHLTDELRNALNPQSGLPRELLLKPESLDRVSVPQAVEHVAKINAWREAQKVAANEAIANNAATHVFKEYAENNPKGLRWVELKAQPKTDELGNVVNRGDRDLADALKYEGDTMGHCVGGYCDDVASGASRIFSLRDAKGQPHVTIETTPSRSNKIRDMQAGTPTDFNIVQIKGKGNRKPNDEYLPFVQDFVKSGKWSDVGDLQNAGLYHRQHWPQIDDLDVPLPEGQTYFTGEELSKFRKVPGYASGGAVKGPWWDSYTEEPAKVAAVPSPIKSDAEFMASIKPEMLNAQGQFKAPSAGVNYALEGMTPAEALATAKAIYAQGDWSEDNRLGKINSSAQANNLLDTAWRPGPDNGGGGLGGFARAVGNIATGIAKNPALMGALTAGVGSYINPTISSGLQSAGMSAGTANTVAPLVTNAGKTLLSGGSLGDAAKGAAIGYIGGEVKGLTGSDLAASAAKTVLNGKGLSIDELASQYAMGKISDLSGLPPQTASLVVNLARNKKKSPVGAFSRIVGAVGSGQKRTA